MKDKINEVFNALQELDVKPTPHNVSIMCGVYDFLKIIYKELEEKENVGTESESYTGKHGAENGATADLS
jgi:hypothetical protein